MPQSVSKPASESVSKTTSTPPQVFSVQHFCVHDGPGIRSVVFFKGCPLRCSWCQNPESWSLDAELGYKQRQCIGCGTCVKTCTSGAMLSPGNWSADDCTRCFRCVETCPGGALTRFGEARSVEDIYRELAQEFALFRQSGGGVTFSGGEASLFPEYVAALIAPLRAAGIHTAMETCGLFRLENIEETISGIDLLLFDLKIIDAARHREHCGADNARILANFRTLAERARNGTGPQLWPRLPLVPGINDDEENLRAVARFVREAGIHAITLLPYHNLGSEKFDWLRMPTAFRDAMLPEERLAQARRIVEEEGLRWYESGEEDYSAAQGETSCTSRAAS